MPRREPRLQRFLDDLATCLGHLPQKDGEARDKCCFCKNPVGDFTDELSRQEYKISGACQNCQDWIFVEEEEEEDGDR